MTPADSQRLVEALSPFSRRIGLFAEDISPSEVRLRLPLHTENLNLVGAVHEGAVFTMAEAAVVILGNVAFATENLSFITKRAEVRYRRAGKGDLWARAQLLHETRQAALDHALTEGKVDVPLGVEITDQAGERVADVTVTLSLRRL